MSSNIESKISKGYKFFRGQIFAGNYYYIQSCVQFTINYNRLG